MDIQGHLFQNKQAFELVISDSQSGGRNKRIVFEVHAMFKATPPSESSYLQGVMYFLFTDYVNAPVFGEDPPESAVPRGGIDVFLLNPGTTTGRAIEHFLVDLPANEIIHVLRRLRSISKPGFQSSTDVPYALRCSWIYTAARIGKGETFTPIYNGDEKTPPIPAQLGVGDFFCGAGGFSEGFRRAGFPIKFGVDKDERASTSWQVRNSTFSCLAVPLRCQLVQPPFCEDLLGGHRRPSCNEKGWHNPFTRNSDCFDFSTLPRFQYRQSWRKK